LLAGNPSAGALVAWFADRFGPVDPTSIAAEAARHVRDCAERDLVLHPYPVGRQSPLPDPGARLRLTDGAGNDRAWPADPGVGFAALVRGLAHQSRWMFDALDHVAGADANSPIRTSGGAVAGNEAWLAARAAVMPHAQLLTMVPEPVAAGAALRAAVLCGLSDSDQTLSSMPVPPTHGAAADRVHARFLDLVAPDRTPAGSPR
jgi:sugar (pentulose or hexulose) kinase